MLQITTRISDFSEFMPERSEFAHQGPDPYYIFALQDAQIYIKYSVEAHHLSKPP